MMNNLDDALAQLKDIHEPSPVGWWPLAPGWYLLAICVIAILVLSIYLYKVRRNSIKRIAKHELDRIERDFAINHNEIDLIKNISQFLRRVMLTTDAEYSASLTGNKWLSLLDEQSKAKVFESGPGRVIVDAPYRQDIKINSEELLKATRQWMRGLK